MPPSPSPSPSHSPSPSAIWVYGHHDLDGIVAAAITLSYLRSRYPGARLSAQTVDFHLKGEWPSLWERLQREENPPDGVAIVDFPATGIPDGAFLFYADHHPTSFEQSPVLEQQYAARAAAGEPVFHEITGSCSELLLRTLAERDGWQAPATLRAAAEVAHQVDTAGYDTPAAALDFRYGGAPLYDQLAVRLSEDDASRVIEALATGATLHDAILQAYPERVAALRQQLAVNIGLYNELSERIGASTSFIDLTRAGVPDPMRVKFAEFQEAGVDFALQLCASQLGDGAVQVMGTLGRSPWASPPPPGFAYPDLGKVANSLAGGGGHPFAAGFRVTNRSRTQAVAEARRLAITMLPFLEPLPADHEYAYAPSATPVAAPAEEVKAGGVLPEMTNASQSHSDREPARGRARS